MIFTTESGLRTNSLSKLSIIDNELIIGTFGKGLSKLNLTNLSFSQFSEVGEIHKEFTINDIYNYNDSLLYIATNNGLKVIENNRVKSIALNLEDSIISAVFCQDPNNLWVGTKGNGLYAIQYLRDKEIITNHRNNPLELSSICGDMIYDIMQDFSGNIWATTQEGVSFFDPLKQNFALVTNNFSEEEFLMDKNIWSIYEENDTIVWVGNRKGLSRLNLQNGETENYPFISENKLLLANNDIWDIHVDKMQNIWVGTNSGIYKFLKNKKNSKGNYVKFSPNVVRDDLPVYDLNVNDENELWAATKNGVYVFDLNNEDYVHFVSHQDSAIFFPDADCRRIYFSSSYTWLGFDGGGLCRIERKKI